MEFEKRRKLLNYRRKKSESFTALKKTVKSTWYYIYYFGIYEILFLFVEKEKDALQKLTDNEYREIFIKGRTKEQIQMSYQKAWEAKNFEIDLYWRRATYFWAFQIASFAGYFTVLNSKQFEENNPKDHVILYFVVCIGFITALAWALINQGSKTWQRHWEIHVDMLEDEITGPLYKIVTTAKTYSVSKINDLVSRFFTCVWILLAIHYFGNYITFNPYSNGGLNWIVILISIIVLFFVGSMQWGYGRGRFGERVVRFYSRKFKPQ
ncbi:hypothetical protein BDE36_2056 [Arcticibacter tournemirensis]|uniref:Uncharacterized protein n=1 Tax=Arcticibacter tournemirensis TaxID=699437 RepID=A0A5M9HIY6_9SPHI|nr:hypothetical protein [Arcticibacter tournemirensis]KAA8485394.1 hypothetical protein F1649_04565 [Arcticibacter tournemirensis]TQM50314.1 hypothetical protein BDE36_2056 [Arcticibacter tournemirensis]